MIALPVVLLFGYGASNLSAEEKADGLEFEICRPNADGGLEIYNAPIVPSFSHPRVAPTELEVVGLSWTDDDGIRGAVSCKGQVKSSILLSSSKEILELGSGFIYVNGDSEPVGNFAVNPPPEEQEIRTSGTFKFRLENIPMTEGLNTLRIAYPDPVTGIEGGRTVTFTISLGNDELTPVPKLAAFESLVDESPGQKDFFMIVAKGEASNPPVKIWIGEDKTKKGIECRFKAIKPEGTYIVSSEKQNMLFGLLPAKGAYDNSRASRLADLAERLAIKGSLSSREKFLLGYSKGIYLNGVDLISGIGESVGNAAVLSTDNMDLELPVNWEFKDGTTGNGVIKIAKKTGKGAF